jgi:hypothetical protein
METQTTSADDANETPLFMTQLKKLVDEKKNRDGRTVLRVRRSECSEKGPRFEPSMVFY